MTEDVHQQSIGAVTGVEFHPPPVSVGARFFPMTMCLREPFAPLGVGTDAGIGGRVEVTVPVLVVLSKEDDWMVAKREVMDELASIRQGLGAPG